jgi:extracellular elastinolytic metalloproteinase
LAVASAFALTAPAHAAPRPFFDVRQAATPAQPGPATRALERRLGEQAVVELDKVTRTPRMLARLDGALTRSSSDAPEAIALRYVRANLAALGLSEAALDTLDPPTVERSGKLVEVRWRQSAGGIPSADSELRVVLSAKGEVLSVLGAPSNDLGSDTSPKLSAVDALEAVHDDTGTSGPLSRRTALKGATRATRFTDGSGAKLRRYAGRLAWNVTYRAAPDAVYDVMVDADTGKILRRINLVKSAAPADVWEYYPGAANGGQAQEVDLEAKGWLAAGAPTLNGPYVHAFSDLDDDNELDTGEAITRAGDGTFKFPFSARTTGTRGCEAAKPCSWDHASYGSWLDNRLQNGVQAFYLANRFRDHLAAPPINFTDFQGTDKLLLHTMDGASSGPNFAHANNANMMTPPRGESPVMQMYLWGNTADSAFRTMNSGDDASILYHEYAHGLTSRLVTQVADGPSALNSPQAGAMGEGWSDFYAKDFLVGEGYETDDPGTADVHMGAYTDAVPNAIRVQALDCPAGGGSLQRCPAAGSAGAGGFTYGDFGKIANGPSVHRDGEIWAQTLWDLRGAIGVTYARRLITQALRISPPEPSFLDMRNAILLADQAEGATHREQIWAVFANRGMGFYASTTDAADITPLEDFSLPPLPGSPTGTVTGRVTDSVTGEPIEGATAALGGLSGSPDAREGTTGADGRYTVADVIVGGYPSFVFRAPGYDRLVKPVTVTAEEPAELDAELTRNWSASSGGATHTGTDEFPDFGCGPDKALDQTASTVWSAWQQRSIVITLPEPVTISSFGIDPTEGCSDLPSAALGSVTIQASKTAAGETFTTVATATFNSSHRHKLNQVLPTTGGPGAVEDVRRVRVTLNSPQGANPLVDMAEFAVYGYPEGFAPEPTPTPTPTPTATPSPTPTATPTVTPSPTASPVPTVFPTVVPTPFPTPTPTPTATPVPKPKLVLGASGKRAVKFKVTCAAACSVKASVTVDAKTAKRLGLGRARTVASLKRTLAAGSRTLTVKLTEKARRGLARAKLKSFKGTLKVQAGDAKGQRKVTIRR